MSVDKKKNIVLIGMMGSGKSTLGHLIDEKLHDFSYVDIDREIEKLAKKHIAEIFSEQGEPHFRQLEHEMIAKFSNYHNQVISTGGGVVEKAENLELLGKNSVVFYLSATAKELYERVRKTSHRPLLQKQNPEKIIKDLLKKREPFYKTANFEIKTENKDVLELAKEIIEKYESIEC